jgi:hypothetical protein
MKPAQFIQSLQALRLSQSQYAALLTGARDDGKVTTPAVVSRWANGRSAIPPAVTLHLRKELIEKAKSQPPFLGGPKIILVGGAKGGSGATSICQFLTVAATSRGYRARVGATRANFSFMARRAREFLGPFDPAILVDLEDLRATKDMMNERNADILFVDVPSATLLSDTAVRRLDLPLVDLFVVPFNPAGHIDLDPPLKVARALQQCMVDRFLLQPFIDRISLSLILERGGTLDALKAFRTHVSEFPIIKRHSVDEPRPWPAGNKCFQDEDLEIEYLSVLDAVLLRLGANVGRFDLFAHDFDALNFDELLALFGPYGARTPESDRSVPLQIAMQLDVGRLITSR